jgi:hypothetical protein
MDSMSLRPTLRWTSTRDHTSGTRTSPPAAVIESSLLLRMVPCNWGTSAPSSVALVSCLFPRLGSLGLWSAAFILRLLRLYHDTWSFPERSLRANLPDTHPPAFVSRLPRSNATERVPEVSAARAPSCRDQRERDGGLLPLRSVWPRLDNRQDRQIEGRHYQGNQDL